MFNELQRLLTLGLFLGCHFLQAQELRVVVGKEGNLIEQKLQAENLNSSADVPGKWQELDATPSSWNPPPIASFTPTSVLPTVTAQIEALGAPGIPVSAAVNSSLFSDLGASLTTNKPYGVYRQCQLLWKTYHGTTPSMWDMRAYTYWSLDKGHTLAEVELDMRCKKEISDAGPNPPPSADCIGYVSPPDLGDGKTRN